MTVVDDSWGPLLVLLACFIIRSRKKCTSMVFSGSSFQWSIIICESTHRGTAEGSVLKKQVESHHCHHVDRRVIRSFVGWQIWVPHVPKDLYNHEPPLAIQNFSKARDTDDQAA